MISAGISWPGGKKRGFPARHPLLSGRSGRGLPSVGRGSARLQARLGRKSEERCDFERKRELLGARGSLAELLGSERA